MSKPELQFEIKDSTVLTAVMNRVWSNVQKGLGAGPVVIKLGRKKRSLSQNAKMWPMLSDVSRQVNWYGEQLSPEDWKHVFTASLKSQRAVPGIEGGFVVLGQSTSQMSKEVFSQLIELIYAFGANNGVQWSEQAISAYEKYREVQAA